MTEPKNSPDPPPERATSSVPTPHPESFPVLDSRDLFQGRREILIDHDGSLYRLRLTRAGKLILHK